jgi:hypothetical protein
MDGVQAAACLQMYYKVAVDGTVGSSVLNGRDENDPKRSIEPKLLLFSHYFKRN